MNSFKNNYNFLALLILIFAFECKIANAKPFVVSVQKTSLECNEKYAERCSSTYEKLDNGSYTWSLFVHTLVEIHPNVTIAFQSYELKNGQYKKGMFHFSKSFCDFIKSDMWLIKMVKSYSNLPDKCPVPVGDLYVKDFIAKEKNFPPGFPEAAVKFVFVMSVEDIELATLNIELKIEPKSK